MCGKFRLSSSSSSSTTTTTTYSFLSLPCFSKCQGFSFTHSFLLLLLPLSDSFQAATVTVAFSLVELIDVKESQTSAIKNERTSSFLLVFVVVVIKTHLLNRLVCVCTVYYFLFFYDFQPLFCFTTMFGCAVREGQSVGRSVVACCCCCCRSMSHTHTHRQAGNA